MEFFLFFLFVSLSFNLYFSLVSSSVRPSLRSPTSRLDLVLEECIVQGLNTNDLFSHHSYFLTAHQHILSQFGQNLAHIHFMTHISSETIITQTPRGNTHTHTHARGVVKPTLRRLQSMLWLVL